MAGISGVGVAMATGGGILMYAGFKGVSPLAALKMVTSGTLTPVSTEPGIATNPFSSGANVGTDTGAPSVPGGQNNIGLGVLSEATQLGSAANNKYVWAATGPNGYDCSGLVWRAMKNRKVAGTPRIRFATISFVATMGKHITKISTPDVGDVVIWPGHMGIVSGSDQFYSARSTKSGIGYATISTWRNGATPKYYRFAAVAAKPKATVPPVRDGTRGD